MCTFGDRSGFVGRPTWEALRAGARAPLPPEGTEHGEWQHDWQYHAFSSSKLLFRDAVVFVQSCPANQAHLRSHSGRASSAALHGVPSGLEFKLAPDVLRTLVLERMRLILQVSEGPGVRIASGRSKTAPRCMSTQSPTLDFTAFRCSGHLPLVDRPPFTLQHLHGP